MQAIGLEFFSGEYRFNTNIEYLILDKLFKINICAIEDGIAVIYKTLFSVFTGTITCYIVFLKVIKLLGDELINRNIKLLNLKMKQCIKEHI